MVTTSANLLGINRHRARLLIVLDHQRSNSLVLL
jgi:hypothetical protein